MSNSKYVDESGNVYDSYWAFVNEQGARSADPEEVPAIHYCYAGYAAMPQLSRPYKQKYIELLFTQKHRSKYAKAVRYWLRRRFHG